MLRTRGARSGFVLSRTLNAHGDANDGASERSLHSRPKPKTFQFFASLPRPLPALKREGKVFWFWFGATIPLIHNKLSWYIPQSVIFC